MVDGGQCWMPPPMTLLAGSGSHQTAAQRGGELQVRRASVLCTPGRCCVSVLQGAHRHPRCGRGLQVCRPHGVGIKVGAVVVQDKEEALSEVQRDRFEDLLRGLTAHRAVVRDAMTFCLDNSACATEVVDILTESLTLAETPIPTKVRCTLPSRPCAHISTACCRRCLHSCRRTLWADAYRFCTPLRTSAECAAGSVAGSCEL